MPSDPGLALRVDPTFGVPLIFGVAVVSFPLATDAVATEVRDAGAKPVLVPVTVTVIFAPR